MITGHVRNGAEFIHLLRKAVLGCLLGTLVAIPPTFGAQDSLNSIRLVLQLTIDGLRYDLLTRSADHFGEGGLRYLLESGVVFTNAHYQHANTETIVGHTTLATGAHPSDHGMIGNAWYDREAGELAYNIEDPAYPLLPSRAQAVVGEQVDPSQLLARTDGRSPAAILAETFSDRLAASFGGKSKVFAVSGKDRGAVSMAGHSGKAFWMSSDSGDFVTSSFYYKEYPAWVADWNDKRKVESLGGEEWSLLHDIDTYRLGHQDDRPYEVDLRGYGRTFPHTYGEVGNPLLPTQVLASPSGDRLTVDFASGLVQAEGLGSDDIPDYLGISLSGVDAVNHFFGPASLENEDMVRQLDVTLAELFEFIDQSIGLEHTLIVLSADHGMAEMPEYMSELGFDVGRLSPDEVVAAADTAGNEMFGIEGVSKFFFRPYLYLDTEGIKAAGLDVDAVSRAVAASISETEGVTIAAAATDIVLPQVTPLMQQLQKTYHPGRAGDIYVVQDPYWFNFEEGPVAAMHGSPWRYDTHVPIIFAGAGTAPQHVHRLVHPVDVAPTLSGLLGMSAPASARGDVLPEVSMGSDSIDLIRH